MTREAVRAARHRAGWTQATLAGLLGVHPLTVAKWEAGALVPDAYRGALLEAVARVELDVARAVPGLLASRGVVAALAAVLRGVAP